MATSTLLKVLLAFMGICFIRFLIDFPVYRLDALRDSSIWYYGACALLVSAAACCDPAFVPRLLGWYWRILPWFLLWAPVAVVATQSKALTAISVPGSSTPINSFKTGDLQVHVALALAFLWLGGGRFAGAHRSRYLGTLLSTIGMVTLLMAGSQNRGGLLASLVVLTIALAYLPPGRRRRVVVGAVGGLAVAVALVMLLDLRVQGERRDISLQQVATNIKSVLGGEEEAGGELSGNVHWREDYWGQVLKDSLAPKNKLHGLGFGPLLPSRFEVPVEADNPQPLRNAHNSHLTILARAGLPAFTLWAVLWLAWIGLLAGWIRRRPGGVRDPGAAVAVWLLAAGPAFLINAFFDPVLEGPQGGIWLFTLLGLGAALLRGRDAAS